MIRAVRRLLNPDRVVLPGVDAARGGWRHVERWFDEFPPDVSSRVRQLCETADTGTWILPPDPSIGRFKLHAAHSLHEVSETFEQLQQTLPEPRRIIWCLDAFETHGLEPQECEAVAAPWLHVDDVHAVAVGVHDAKLVLVGQLRRESLAWVVRLGGLTGLARAATLAALDLLSAPMLPWNVPAPLVLIAPNQVLELARDAAACDLLRDLVEWRAGALGIALPPGAASLEDAARARATLADRVGVPVVGFAAVPSSRLRASQADLGLGGFEIDVSAGDVREDAYPDAGAYWPQPFDPRTPSAVRHASVPVQVVRTVVHESLSETWRRRTAVRSSVERLTPLLDFERLEAFHRQEGSDPSWGRRYPEYRVFNWPIPDPVDRVTLFDLGRIESPVALLRRVFELKRLADAIGSRAVLIGGQTLAAAARREADARVPASSRTVDAQRRAHDYLRDISTDAPLRADYARFLEGLPSHAGDVLEIGAGLGQLARAFRARARSLVCLDLDWRMVRDAVHGTPNRGTAADFHRLPFASAAFDTIVANNVLEHAADVPAALAEIRRVLRPGGALHALLPLDALNPSHQLRAHWWKADEANIASALTMARLLPRRLTRLDLDELGVRGAFPSCNGYVCAVEGVRN